MVFRYSRRSGWHQSWSDRAFLAFVILLILRVLTEFGVFNLKQVAGNKIKACRLKHLPRLNQMVRHPEFSHRPRRTHTPRCCFPYSRVHSLYVGGTQCSSRTPAIRNRRRTDPHTSCCLRGSNCCPTRCKSMDNSHLHHSLICSYSRAPDMDI